MDARTRVIEEGGYVEGRGRYTGVGVTLYGRGEAVAVSRSAGSGYRGGVTYLGKDVSGSVRSATGEDGTLEDLYEYDAFGKPYKGDLTQGMNLGYTGKPWDAVTGLYNYGYRDYTPEAARFTTVDPVRDGANWFAYVNNDPVNWVDDQGLSATDKAYKVGETIGDSISDGIRSIVGAITTGVNVGGFNISPDGKNVAITPGGGITVTGNGSGVTVTYTSGNGNTYGASFTGKGITIGGRIPYNVVCPVDPQNDDWHPENNTPDKKGWQSMNIPDPSAAYNPGLISGKEG
jgi:RHS repeat-associated protein